MTLCCWSRSSSLSPWHSCSTTSMTVYVARTTRHNCSSYQCMVPSHVLLYPAALVLVAVGTTLARPLVAHPRLPKMNIHKIICQCRGRLTGLYRSTLRVFLLEKRSFLREYSFARAGRSANRL